jgi:hypothetical protein
VFDRDLVAGYLRGDHGLDALKDCSPGRHGCAMDAMKCQKAKQPYTYDEFWGLFLGFGLGAMLGLYGGGGGGAGGVERGVGPGFVRVAEGDPVAGTVFGAGGLRDSVPDVVERIREMTRSGELAGRCRVIADATGVGRPVIEMLQRADLRCRVIPVVVTGGDKEVRDGEYYRVPKRT